MIARAKLLYDLRKTMNAGTPVVGSWLQLDSPEVAEIIADAGYDWLLIDMEHGSISISQVPNLVRAIQSSGCLPIIRVADHQASHCKAALDAGAGGVLVPDVRSALELVEIISYCAWPPRGKRGVGFSRANLYGKYFDQYRDEAQEPLIVAQIENILAIEDLEQIVKVDGLDAVCLGPYDLSASMGITGEFDHPRFLEVIEYYERVVSNSQVACGTHVVHPEIGVLREMVARGYMFIGYGTDAGFLLLSCSNPVSRS